MQNRNKLLLELRPELDLAVASGVLEQFQNKTLRPILKFQNELLINICRQQFVKRKNVYFQLSSSKQLVYIEQQVIQDKNFKSLLFGVIIGYLTSEEYKFYRLNEPELRKRLTSLLIQRFQDQYEQILPFSLT